MDVENSKINLIKIIIIIRRLRICWWRKNIIIILLSLELILLTLFFSLSTSLTNLPSFSLFIILILIVRGSTLGLRILVSLSYSHNSSNPIFINLLTFDKNTYSNNNILYFYKKFKLKYYTHILFNFNYTTKLLNKSYINS